MQSWPHFLFLRHGQTDWNLQGRFQGHTDVPLNETGIAQAHDAADKLSSCKIDRIVCSPLIRALKTAAVIAERISLPVHIDKRISERDYGSFDGLIAADVKRQHGLALHEPANSIFPPDVEPWPNMLSRTHSAFRDWLGNRPDEVLLFVAHNGVFRALAETLLDETFESRNALPYKFLPGPDGWTASEIA